MNHSPLTTHHSLARHGVVLLVILGMLAALALLGVFFLAVSGQEERSSDAYRSSFQNPKADLDVNVVMIEGLGQLVAGTSNPLSAVRGHDLLGDVYGPGNDRNGNGVIDVEEYYFGAFSGPGDRGLYQPITGPGGDGMFGTPDDVIEYGPDSTPGTADDPFAVNFVYNKRSPNPTSGGLAGGFNEDYDYPDRQNMFIALVRADGTVLVPSFQRPGAGAPADTDLTNFGWNTPEGARARLKFLRPRGGFGPDGKPGVAGVDDDMNGIVDDLSERGWVGSDDSENPLFPAQTSLALLDLDNNGDGVPDSIWIDLGFPVQQTLDGRKFKPLFAFLVVDLDGKLNLNVHGNVANTTISPPLRDHADFDVTTSLPLGSGWSVSEVCLQNMFKDVAALPSYTSLPGVDSDEYRWLLQGRRPVDTPPAPAPVTVVAGRYGEPELWAAMVAPRAGRTDYIGAPPAPSTPPVVGDDDTPESTGAPPYWAYPTQGDWNEGRRGVFNNYLLNALKNGRFGTPPDFDGDGLLGVDSRGRFIYYPPAVSMGWGGVAPEWPATMISAGESTEHENSDEQDELDVYAGQSFDALFTPADLEYLYRFHDLDWSTLSSRLFWLTPSLTPPSSAGRAILDAAARRRMMVTTESWDLNRFNMFPLTRAVDSPTSPAPPNETLLTGALAGNGKFNNNGLAGPPIPAQAPGLVSTEPGLQPGLPLEVARGRRLDLNRGYFGTTDLYYRNAVPYPAGDGNNDPRTVARDIYILLRQLYPVAPADVAAIERMAQYAVNVVDFRDTDQIMTGFEYTIDLAFGWSVDGDLETNEGSNRALVWGVEAPQVVINETLSFEDPNDPGNPQLWFELVNPQHQDVTDRAFEVNLRGPAPQSAYQVVLSDTMPNTATGEPATRNRILEFTAMPDHSGHPNTPDTDGPAVGGTGTTLIDPVGDSPAPNYFLVGAGANAAFGIPAPDFNVPPGTFAPTMAEIGQTLRLYLRRLADPTRDHDPGPDHIDGTVDDVNPYITVDAADVEVFSMNAVMPPMMMPPTFYSRERRTAYSVRTQPHSSGSTSPHSLSSENENVSLPFAPLAFHDRPFSSAMELLLVPAVRPQWLTTVFVVPSAAGLASPAPYQPTGMQERPGPLSIVPCLTGDGSFAQADRPFLGSPDYLFGHMFNFFREVPGGAYPVPGLHRLLEFVEVPSRMNRSREPAIGPLAGDSRRDRVPAKMNLNTTTEVEQFLAVFNNHPLAIETGAIPPSATPTTVPVGYVGKSATLARDSELFKRYLNSLFGADGILGTPDDLPFRSLSIGTATIPAPQPIQSVDIHNTLLRAWPTTGGIGGPRSVGGPPLLLDTRTVAPPGGSGATDLLGYPNFQQQAIQKIGNIATTRSNVYAVWITVGFFEVLNEDPARLLAAGIANAPPELGAEINADIGQNTRHRAFFIIDRSRARGYLGPPRTSAELQDILSQVVIHSRIIE